MIELPEAHTIAQQIEGTLGGKVIAAGLRGNTPHKFAFYSGTPEHYAEILAGKTVAGARAHGRCIVVDVEPGYALVLGEGGERILYHRDASTLPAKHHLLLSFTDGTHLSVSVQGWGAAQLVPRAELATRSQAGPERVSPLSDAFTLQAFNGLWDRLAPDDTSSVKYLAISKPGIWGLGNGYLQDVLFRAGLHPRRRALGLDADERRSLHEATVAVLREATALAGRDTERDLFNQPGGYTRVLDSTKVGTPCPVCGTPIEKTQYLGGACYFCPACQPQEA
ncbi:MAG: endonuclease VIII [Chloroflexi bacterium]|nr:endonuclease VIII [Chloroflexota bacterium]